MFPSSKLFNRKGKVYRRQETFGLKKKVFMLTILVLVSAAFLYVPFSLVQGQQVGTVITAVNPSSGIAGAQLTVNVQGTIETANGTFVIFLNGNNVTQDISVGYSVNANFTVYSVYPGNYTIVLKDVATGNQTIPLSYHVVAEGLAAIPLATMLIMLVAVAISFANMGLNRLLITKMIGWQEYRSMQKEMSEYNSQRMAALRAKDTKTLERLKKKNRKLQLCRGRCLSRS